MPVDADGNVADVLAYAKGAIARLNTGQMYDHYINAASRDMSKLIRRKYSESVGTDDLFNMLMEYYLAVAPTQHNEMARHYLSVEIRADHVKSVIDNGIYLHVSATDPHIDKDIVNKIRKVISPTYGPVTYINDVGETIVTKDKVFIGIMNMILLEKTDMHPMSVSSAALQHHGLLAGSSKVSRLSHPSKQQSVRAFGETECRLYAATLGGDFVAEILDLANNPDSHREVIRSILKADNPAKVKELVNRTKNPLGNSRALGFVNHILTCMGFSIMD